MKTGLLFRAFVAYLIMAACESRPPIPECNPSSDLSIFLVEATGTSCGVPGGRIVVKGTGGAGGYRFQLDKTPYQDSPEFYSVRPGVHTVVLRDKQNCFSAISVVVPSGISFQQSIRPIIETKCAIPTCHDGSGQITYLVFKNIKDNPADIKSRTQSGNMPKIGSLTTEEIEKIACWVDDGALDN